jgi:Insecticidal Crystal Toxin, P42
MGTPASVSKYIQQTAGKWLDEGVPFDPFLIKTYGTAAQIWDGNGNDGHVAFWRPAPQGAFRPLGGLAVRDTRGPEEYGITYIRPMPGKESAVANPVKWARVFSDAGSGNSRDLVAWYAVPPAGYVSLGLWFTNGEVPPMDALYCVREDYAIELPGTGYWGDSGMHFHADGHLLRPAFTKNADGSIAQTVPHKLTIIPNVTVYGRFANFINPPFQFEILESKPYGLLVSQLQAPATVVLDAPRPKLTTADVRATGTQTDHGVKQVVVVPYLGITDPGIRARRPLEAPFYYVAGESFFTLTLAHQQSSGGQDTESLTTGVTQEQTNAFEKTTSVTVSATAGVEIGPGSASVSYEMTNSFTSSHSETNSYMHQTELTVQIEATAGTAFERWRRTLGIRIYRPDGTPLDSTLDAISSTDLYDVSYPKAKVTEKSANIQPLGLKMPAFEAA